MNPVIRPRSLFIALSLLLALALWLSLALGPVSLPLLDTLKAALRLLAGASLAQPRFAGWALATAEAEALRRRRELEGPTATS